jgi:glyoxylase-like metal-dependent hydrolase (beta-lactamase superfamily II)
MIEIESAEASGQVKKLRLAHNVPGLERYYTAAYWVDGLMIDTGCAHTAVQTLAAVRQWRVAQIANTHSHEDHIGANAEIQSAFGCPVRAHPLALPILENPRLQPLQPYRLLFWGRPRACRGEAIGEWVETERLRFQVIPTPGHSPDHVCLFEPQQGWLFCGDAYVGGKDRALRAGYDIHGIIASLKVLAELPVQTLFTGSGSVRSNGTQPLVDKVAYLEELGEQIRTLAGQGVSPRQIRRRLLGPEPQISRLTLGHFSGMRLVRSYLSAPEAGPDTG